MVSRRGFLILLSGAALAQVNGPEFEQLTAALGAKPGAMIADVGAGEGRYTFRLASVVGPEGKVWAVDVAKPALRELRRKAEEGKVTNVAVVEGKEDDPLLPKGTLDAVLVVNAYHEMEQHASMMRHMREALKPGGRLVIVDQKPSAANSEKPRINQQDKHSLSPAFVVADMKEAGLEVLKTTDATDSDHVGRYWIVARRTN